MPRALRISPRFYFGVSSTEEGMSIWRTESRVGLHDSPKYGGDTPICTSVIKDLYLEEVSELIQLLSKSLRSYDQQEDRDGS
jgi:hypothetical protein